MTNLIKIAFIILLSNTLVYGNLTGREIIEKNSNIPDGNTRKSHMIMTLINKRERKRVRDILSFRKDFGKDKKSIMYFKAPNDIKGTGYLSWEYDEIGKEDDKWLYLPALKKTRRISGANKNDSFMGSDFSYDDLGDRNVDEDIHQLINTEIIKGTECYVVLSTPKDSDYQYSKVISWIRKDNFILYKADFYNKQNKLYKQLFIEEFAEIQGYLTVNKMIMKDLLRKHRTILEFNNIVYDLPLKDKLFNLQNLNRARFK